MQNSWSPWDIFSLVDIVPCLAVVRVPDIILVVSLIGIATDDLTRVFERFYRTDRGRAATKKGKYLLKNPRLKITLAMLPRLLAD